MVVISGLILHFLLGCFLLEGLVYAVDNKEGNGIAEEGGGRGCEIKREGISFLASVHQYIAAEGLAPAGIVGQDRWGTRISRSPKIGT